MLFSSPLTRVELLLRELYKDRILPDAVDPAPWDHNIRVFPEPQKARSPRHDQGADPTVTNVDLKIANVSEPSTVAKIDDLFLSELIGSHFSHTNPSTIRFAEARSVQTPFYEGMYKKRPKATYVFPLGIPFVCRRLSRNRTYKSPKADARISVAPR